MKIQTVISPSLFSQIESIEDKIVVVIDILRATSTITTIINNNAKALIAVKKESGALEYKNDDYLIGGERNGETIPGFDFGNSPFDYKKDLVRNKTVILTTTNGTKCIEMSSNASEVIIGSFLNLTAVVNYVQGKGKDIVLFCAGWKDKVNLEDSLFAGAFALKIQNAIKDDSTLLCMKAYENGKEDLFETLKKSNHFNRLKNKGVVDDIKYCCNIDTTDVVPKLKRGLIVK
ncbi:MAG: 2-phosphosulfolactate phosphatase [Bacteroidetes bacterium]|nr:2-phosphosulfolactate phosphatase [Bacteroidota bacterium]